MDEKRLLQTGGLCPCGSDPLNKERFASFLAKRTKKMSRLIYAALSAGTALFSALCTNCHGMSEHHRLQFRVHAINPNGWSNKKENWATQRIFADLLFAFLSSTVLIIWFAKRCFPSNPHARDSQSGIAIKSLYWEILRPLSAYRLWLKTRTPRNSRGSSQL